MQVVSCRNCGARVDWQVHAEHVTVACVCGMRVAAQYVFSWQQLPALLRAQATKAFGAYGKWRIQPLTALSLAMQQVTNARSAAACSGAIGAER